MLCLAVGRRGLHKMQRQQGRPDLRFLAGNERRQTARECMALARRLHDTPHRAESPSMLKPRVSAAHTRQMTSSGRRAKAAGFTPVRCVKRVEP